MIPIYKYFPKNCFGRKFLGRDLLTKNRTCFLGGVRGLARLIESARHQDPQSEDCYNGDKSPYQVIGLIGSLGSGLEGSSGSGLAIGFRSTSGLLGQWDSWWTDRLAWVANFLSQN
jgi:hypothetical protein